MMKNSAPAKTFHELQALSIIDSIGYFKNLQDILEKTVVTLVRSDLSTLALNINNSIGIVIADLINITALRKRLFVVGNGGSAAIAIHTAADYANAGGFKTVDLMSPSLLTCMANDYGYENVFSQPIEMFAEAGDMLFAISSSGQSQNIINACRSALVKKCPVITFSGFKPDNPLRKLGRLNFYVPSPHYGFVELTHQIIIHCILDLFVRNKVYEEARESLG